MTRERKQANLEDSVIGILLRDPGEIVKHEIDERWFHKWRRVIAAAKAIAAAGNEVDILTLHQEINQSEILKELNFLRAENWSSTQNLPIYLDGLRSICKAKDLQKTLSSALAELQDGGEVDAVVGQLMQSTLVAVSAESRNYSSTIKQAMGAFVDQLDQAFEARETGGLGLKTGIAALDRAMGGMHPSDMIVVGARPGVGKTAFGLTVLQSLAKAGKRVGFISTEMSSSQVMLRIAAANSGISGQALRDASLQDSEWPLLTAAINNVTNLNFRVFDKPNVTVADVAMQAKAWAIDGGIDFIVIDYLTRVKPVKSSGNQTNDVGEVATGLKNIARQLNVPVMVLAQLNRNPANRGDSKPRMADLRDSGVIEQEADQILLLYRNNVDDTAPAEIIIDKNRHGECADVWCHYQPQTMQWLNLPSNTN